MTSALTSQELRTLVTEGARLELSIATTEIDEPAADEIVVRIEAAPINPTDLALLFGSADLSTLRREGSDQSPLTVADIPERYLRVMKPRLGHSLPAGAEGAGVVVQVGKSDSARALLGKTVSMAGDGMYAQYRKVKADSVMVMPDAVTPIQAASSNVNPMTVLAMIETMRKDGHTAIVHTVAASNLGQMLNRVCLKERIGLVNIVRSSEQEELLRDAGAAHVVNSSSENFRADLTEAIAATGATAAFDALGGGRMGNTVFSCMERALTQGAKYSRYGSDGFKQMYVYGRLDLSPQEFTAAYGFSWQISGWLLSHFLQTATPENIAEMKQKVASEITTTFASHYTAEVSLAGALSPEAIAVYSQRSTGNKYLLLPHKD